MHPEDARLREMGFRPLVDKSGTPQLVVPRRGLSTADHTDLMKAHFDTMVGNIEHAYRLAGEHGQMLGSNWYPQAAEYAHNIGTEAISRHRETLRGADPLTVGAGLVSATSPNTAWNLNLIQAHEAAKYGTPQTHVMYKQDKQRKVDRILSGEHPNTVLPYAIKTGHFFRNIMGDPDSITVDAHAHDVATAFKVTKDRPFAGGSDGRGGLSGGGAQGNGRYDHFVRAYQTAAAGLGVPGREVQATAWEHWRGLYPRAEAYSYDPRAV